MFGVTRNPYDLERTVGGSSGGSGAALAANFSTVTIGEETLASIRRPGGWNSVVALRPTPGLVSRSGMWDGYPTVHAQMGPMARTVRDVAKVLDGMVGYDPEDPVTALGVGKIRRHLHALPEPERAERRAHRDPARIHRAEFRPERCRLQDDRCGIREECRGAQGRGRDPGRSGRDSRPQDADRQARARTRTRPTRRLSSTSRALPIRRSRRGTTSSIRPTSRRATRRRTSRAGRPRPRRSMRNATPTTCWRANN